MTDARWRLVCDRLTVVRGMSTVLREIDLEIGSGESVTLIGPNGAGKTTLLLALLGLLPASGGSVTVDDRPIDGMGSRARGRFSAYVPQTIERIPAFTIYDVVAAGRYPHVRPLHPLSNADRAAVDRALRMAGLSDLAQRQVNEVSGGERQKALIAAAIAQDAQAMFLDEPNTALDPAYQIELVQLLRAWHEAGRTLVLVSHDLQLPAALGGRVVALRDGCIVADAAASEVLTPERLSEIYQAEFDVARTQEGRRIVLPSWWK